jgi:hypothetical protein
LPSPSGVDGLRQEQADSKREIKRLANAPPSLAEVESEIDAYIAAANQAEPFVRVNHRGVTINLFTEAPLEHVVSLRSEHVRAIESWIVRLAPDRVRQELIAAATHQAHEAGGWGLPDAERKRAIAALEARVFDLELKEERLIEQLEDGGVDIARRADADPRAVLALEPVAIPA